MKGKPSSFNLRRRFLVGLASLGVGLPVAGYWLSGARSQLTKEEKMVISLVDTIVPADDMPGALDAKIDKVLSIRMSKQKVLAQRIIRLNIAIEKIAIAKYRRAFYTLNIDQRESILDGLLKYGAPRIARADLSNVRRLVLVEFYSSREGRDSINYVLPSNYPAYS